MQGFDIVLGADVCYSLKALPVLLGAAAQLLSPKSGSIFLLGYVSRYCHVLLLCLWVHWCALHAHAVHAASWLILACGSCRAFSMDKQLLVEAERVGFDVEELLDQWQQLPGSLKGMVYALTHRV